MTPFLIAIALIWGLGALFGAPRRQRLGLTALLFAAILALHAFLPAHPMTRAFGGSFAGWATLAGFSGLAAAYGAGVSWIRARAPEAPAAREKSGSHPESRNLDSRGSKAPEAAQGKPTMGTFTAEELDRYARHIMLREVGGPGQKALKAGRVLVVGAGGLGSPALLYLAAAGVGTIGIVDDDTVSRSNLQRQVLYGEGDIGRPKVEAAREALLALNPNITVETHPVRLSEDNAGQIVSGYGLVLEGTDNFATRYLVNRVCAQRGIPVIGGAISQWEGQISTWDPKNGAPCYQCVFPEAPAAGLAPTCAEAGVIGPLPGVIGAMMAGEAVKELAGAGEGLRGRLLIWDGLHAETRVIRLKPRADCPVCGGGAVAAEAAGA